jgi:hypothetical protein
MAATCDNVRRRIGQLLLLALLVVPLRLSAHVHVDRAIPSSACSICTIASHWVTEHAPPPATVEPRLLSVRVVSAGPRRIVTRPAPVRLGRAPPPTPFTHL